MLARWRANPIGFIQQVLINPETKKPFVLLDAERAFLTHAFATGPDGRLLYPEQVYACPKKSGKTTFAAIYVITLVLLYGGAYRRSDLRSQRLRSICWTRVRGDPQDYRVLAAAARRSQDYDR